MPLFHSDAKKIMQAFAEKYNVDIPSITDERTATSAYRTLALKIHPDKNKIRKDMAEVDFKQLGAAYTSLMDPLLKDAENRTNVERRSFFTPEHRDVSEDFWQGMQRTRPASAAAAFAEAKNLDAGSFAGIRHTGLRGEEALRSTLAQDLQVPVSDMIAQLKIYLYLESTYSNIVHENGQSDGELSDFNIAFTVPIDNGSTTGVHIRLDICGSGGLFSPDTQFSQELLEKLKACHFVFNTGEMGRRGLTETVAIEGKHYNGVLPSDVLSIDLVNDIFMKVSQLIMQVTERLDAVLAQTDVAKRPRI